MAKGTTKVKVDKFEQGIKKTSWWMIFPCLFITAGLIFNPGAVLGAFALLFLVFCIIIKKSDNKGENNK